jgi:heme-degrading monooxygenase HmoA
MFVRVSHMKPKQGQQKRLIELLDKLSAYYHEQPGYISGYILSPYEGAGGDAMRWGRVGLWETVSGAEEAAQQEHAMALRAELTRIVEEDSHYELTFQGAPDK